MRVQTGMIWLLAALLVTTLTLAGCPRAPSTDAPSTPTVAAPAAAKAAQPEPGVPANIGNGRNADGKYVCPVMGTALTKLDPKLSFEYEGKVYYFCCDGCPQKFRADPAKYIA